MSESYLSRATLWAMAERRRPGSCPSGARLAVSLVVNFEEGAELAVSDGDPPGREDLARSSASFRPARWDQGNEQIFAYGMRAGIWRMLDRAAAARLPDRPSTCAAARSSALPQIARAGRRGGPRGRPATAGCWRPHADYDRRRQPSARDLERCIDVMQARHRPASMGFFCRGSESPWTRGAPARPRLRLCQQRLRRRPALLGPQRRRAGRCWSCPTRSTATT